MEKVLDILLAVLRTLDASDFSGSSSSFIQPYSSKHDLGSSPYFDLPSVLVPPEVIELENMAETEEADAAAQKPEEWPEYRIRLFDNDVGENTATLVGLF